MFDADFCPKSDEYWETWVPWPVWLVTVFSWTFQNIVEQELQKTSNYNKHTSLNLCLQ